MHLSFVKYAFVIFRYVVYRINTHLGLLTSTDSRGVRQTTLNWEIRYVKKGRAGNERLGRHREVGKAKKGREGNERHRKVGKAMKGWEGKER